MTKPKGIDRRTFIAAAVAGLSIAVLASAKINNGKELRMYVGTYTSGTAKGKGIYLVSFDARTGKLSEPKLVAATDEPSFLAVSHNGEFLYAVNETLKYEGSDSGSVSSFEIDQTDGSLKFINRTSSNGSAPCHITINEKGDLVLVANYLGGNVSAFPVKTDGSLQSASDTKQDTGNGPNAERQEAPHCHSIILDRSNKFAVVNDLGIDRIVTYSVDHKNGKLTANGESFATKPGAGPRHFKFHPNGKFAFANNELNMTVTSLAWDQKLGRLTEIQYLSTLPDGYKRNNDSVADLHVSRDGRFLYVSNRGHDSIVSYVIDEKTGHLRLLEFVKTGGKGPRNIAIDPTGNFLLSANQRSDSITVFRIDKASGKLAATENTIAAPTPVCLIFGR